MDKGEKAVTEKISGRVSRDSFDRGTLVDHGSVDRDHGDHVRQILNEVAESIFTAAQDRGGFESIANIAKNPQHCWSSAQFGCADTDFDRHRASICPAQFEFPATPGI